MKLLRPSTVIALLIIAAPALAQPAGMGAGCIKGYEVYAGSKGSKAFAKGKTKGCGYAYGKADIAEARKAALNFCRGHGGDSCRVVESSR
jgi:hypothetical protein